MCECVFAQTICSLQEQYSDVISLILFFGYYVHKSLTQKEIKISGGLEGGRKERGEACVEMECSISLVNNSITADRKPPLSFLVVLVAVYVYVCFPIHKESQ